MKPSHALKIHREEVKKAVRARKAFNARVFGSVLAGTDTDGSDLDLLVGVHPETPVFVRRGHSGGKTNARSAGFRNC